MEESTTVTGQVLNIQHFCVDDGPGIRTTVFLKGCPLRCVWCHNPETHLRTKELMYHPEKCRSCGECTAACPEKLHRLDESGIHVLNRTHCLACGACSDACLFDALEIAGKEMTVEEVLADLCSDRIFYETSEGGITLSGGEPTAQPEFSRALLAACKKEGLHTAMETCGVCSEETLRSFIPLVDLFLLDWKISDDTLHQKYTGVSNGTVKRTLSILNAHGAKVILRCPLIPGINDTEDHARGIAELAKKHACILRVEAEPYHPLGIGKSHALGKEPVYTNEAFMENGAAAAFCDLLRSQVTLPVLLSGK